MKINDRRKVVKALAIGVPATWAKPLVDSVVLPAHGEMTSEPIIPPCIVTIVDQGGLNGGDVFNVEVPSEIYNGLSDPDVAPGGDITGFNWLGSQLIWNSTPGTDGIATYQIMRTDTDAPGSEVTNFSEGCPDLVEWVSADDL